MEVNIKQLKKWIQALDSGNFEQGMGYMETHDHKFCCLGVACKVLIPEDKLNTYGYGIQKVLSGNFPDNQKFAPEWLQRINNDFKEKTGECTLGILNDNMGFTFTEIATLLELVYIHKILDN